MSSNPPIPQTSTPPVSRNRNFLAKFRSPLGQRNRSITDFYIDPDDPWRSYFPGDTIKGTVLVTVVRPVRITHIVICLHGYVKVFKNAMPAGETNADLGFIGPGRGRRGAEYMGNGLATLFEDEIVLCGDGRLKEGIYKFRFEMTLPPYALPSSINVSNPPFCKGRSLDVPGCSNGSLVRTRHCLVCAYIYTHSPDNHEPYPHLPQTRQSPRKHRYCPISRSQSPHCYTRTGLQTLKIQSKEQIPRLRCHSRPRYLLNRYPGQRRSCVYRTPTFAKPFPEQRQLFESTQQ